MHISRRRFLGASATAVLVAGTRAKGKVFGANDRVRLGVAGIRSRGNFHRRELGKRDDAEVAAICDVEGRVLERGVARSKEEFGGNPKTYKDVRDMLAGNEIDAVVIATPNHWHTLLAVWAMQAGKDVYVEKPLSHDFFEGRQLAAAAKKYGRVVQHGTQQRASAAAQFDIAKMHEGLIGKIVHSRGYVYKTTKRFSIGFGKEMDPPPFLDWNLWLGPAQERPYMDYEDKDWEADNPFGPYVHYNWHWFWDFGNGEIGNQGVHEMDVAVWGHNRGLPVKVYSTGGRYAWDDQGETPNTQSTSFTYADGSILTFDVRNLGSPGEPGGIGNTFFGTEGYYVRGQGFFDYQNQPIPVERPETEPPKGAPEHDAFLRAVRSRKPEDNVAPPEAGHVSCAHIHLGNIAYRMGQSLEFDPASGCFKDHDAANALLRRNYRPPFVVPELV